MNSWSYAKLLDVVKLILGIALFLSPWGFDVPAGLPSVNAYITGFAIAALAIDAIGAFARWEEWLNLALGMWVAASPWVLGVQDIAAVTVLMIIGILVAALSALELWITHLRSGRQTEVH